MDEDPSGRGDSPEDALRFARRVRAYKNYGCLANCLIGPAFVACGLVSWFIYLSEGLLAPMFVVGCLLLGLLVIRRRTTSHIRRLAVDLVRNYDLRNVGPLIDALDLKDEQ